MSRTIADDVNKRREVYNHYLQLSTPTQEDLERVFSDEELKELCLKHKCKIDMWRWNIVDDYRRAFTKSGRFQKWSKHERLGMLAKAVNKMKPSVLYDEEEIKKTLKEERDFQLKENILSLNFWKHKRNERQLQSNVEEVLQSEMSNPETMVESETMEQIPSECVVHTESMALSEIIEEIPSECVVHTEDINATELHIQNQEQKSHKKNEDEIPTQCEIHTESMNPVELLTQTQGLQVPLVQNVLELSLNSEDDEDYLLEISEDSVETVINSDLQVNKKTDTLYSEEIVSEIAHIYSFNTESLTIDSEVSIQTQDLPFVQSEDVLPPNYDNFKNIIPLTSTQSQCGSEKIAD